MAASPNNPTDPRAVQAMFQRIARRYDAFNTLSTLGRDDSWRRHAARLAAPQRVAYALDAATGTGKLALELARRADKVAAFDFSDRMVAVAHHRLSRQASAKRLVHPLVGDALAMPFGDNTFDCATIAFGVRNVEDPSRCLREFHRVLRPGGRLVVLELSRPNFIPFRLGYEVVFKRLLPLLGWALSGDRAAYQYLPSSVDSFLTPSSLAELMRSAGFTQVAYTLRHLSTITLHLGLKPG